ncbi:Rv3235 family protein [Leucobacter musarum]|uniref:Rv3235 family protein n=1 Tax=Leucobacter musarum TaxID=1930747 RepID=UPI0027B964B9|nr:Rv3235 family protein [Leucobacter musarum]
MRPPRHRPRRSCRNSHCSHSKSWKECDQPVRSQRGSRRALRAERECITRDRRRRVAVPGPAHLCRPLPLVIEASVVLHLDSRSTVVALRFEHREDRWRATDITVL